MPGLVESHEVPSRLAAADVLVSPHAVQKDFIGSPVKIFEYMALGKPIVASRIAQLEEILSDGETALLVEPGRPHSVADALQRLHSDRELANRLGAAAAQEAAANHTWTSRAQMILSDDG
jgi:glycosyltransferase involved in cell wall biosynthesis